jgi:hypothetical protein
MAYFVVARIKVAKGSGPELSTRKPLIYPIRSACAYHPIISEAGMADRCCFLLLSLGHGALEKITHPRVGVLITYGPRSHDLPSLRAELL